MAVDDQTWIHIQRSSRLGKLSWRPWTNLPKLIQAWYGSNKWTWRLSTQGDVQHSWACCGSLWHNPNLQYNRKGFRWYLARPFWIASVPNRLLKLCCFSKCVVQIKVSPQTQLSRTTPDPDQAKAGPKQSTVHESITTATPKLLL